MSEERWSEQVGMPPAGWYPDSTDRDRLRWWDGSAWTDHRAVPEVAPISTSKERGWAAASHLGVPVWGPFLPLTVQLVSPPGSLRRRHATRAFSYQLLYLPFHLFFTARMPFDGSSAPLVSCMLVGFLLELPQVWRALRGNDPFPIPPFQILKP